MYKGMQMKVYSRSQMITRTRGAEHSKIDKMMAHLAMFLRLRIPFLAPPVGSSEFSVTRSILDIMLIQGISRLTMADIADNTPLHDRKLKEARVPVMSGCRVERDEIMNGKI